jgi:hypothetical protein
MKEIIYGNNLKKNTKILIMLVSMEQKLIKKNFVEFIDFNNNYNIWTYIKPHAKIDQVSLDYDYNRCKYIFLFPIKKIQIGITLYFLII